MLSNFQRRLADLPCGSTLKGIAVLHTAFAVAVFRDTLVQFARNGLFNTVGSDARNGAVAWFTLAGAFMFTTGLAVERLEAVQAAQPDADVRFRGIGLFALATAAVGAALMPASGFWLLVPPSVSMILKDSTNTKNRKS
jgi:hypothetical protein